MSVSMGLRYKNEVKTSTNKKIVVKRGIAFMVDWYLSGVLISLPVLTILQNQNKEPVLELRSLSFVWALLAAVLSLTIALLYYVAIVWKWNGQTIGKRTMGLRIYEEGKDKISLRAIWKRQVLGLMFVEGSLVSVTPLIWQVVFYNNVSYQQYLTWAYYGISILSVILLIVSKNKKSIHDYIAHTVVKEK